MHNGVFRDLRTVLEFYDMFNNKSRRLNSETGKSGVKEIFRRPLVDKI